MATYYALIPNLTDAKSIPRLNETLLNSALTALNLQVSAKTGKQIGSPFIQLTRNLKTAKQKAQQNYFVIVLSLDEPSEDVSLLANQGEIFTVERKFNMQLQCHQLYLLYYKQANSTDIVIKPMTYQVAGQMLADGEVYHPGLTVQNHKPVLPHVIAPVKKKKAGIEKNTSLFRADIIHWALLLLTAVGAVIFVANPLWISFALSTLLTNFILPLTGISLMLLSTVALASNINKLSHNKNSVYLGLALGIGLVLLGVACITLGITLSIAGFAASAFAAGFGVLVPALIAISASARKLDNAPVAAKTKTALEQSKQVFANSGVYTKKKPQGTPADMPLTGIQLAMLTNHAAALNR